MLRTVLLIVLVSGALGCDLTRMTAGQTAKLFNRASPAFDQHWDYELAGQGAPGAILQLEGVLQVVPENELLLMQLARAYTGYAYGWVEDELLRTNEMDMDKIDHLQNRAKLMYLRARDHGLAWIRLNSDGFDQAKGRGIPALKEWLREEFDDEEDAEGLLWTGYAWGSAINVARDNPDMIADLEYAKVLVERSVELNEKYYWASGLAILAFAKADFPQALGGDPEGGRALFERALELTERKSLNIQVNFAKSYAVQTQNRELFEQLMNEVVAASVDINPDMRMANTIAKRRAVWYLAHVDALFQGGEEAPPEEPAAE